MFSDTRARGLLYYAKEEISLIHCGDGNQRKFLNSLFISVS